MWSRSLAGLPRSDHGLSEHAKSSLTRCQSIDSPAGHRLAGRWGFSGAAVPSAVRADGWGECRGAKGPRGGRGRHEVAEATGRGGRSGHRERRWRFCGGAPLAACGAVTAGISGPLAACPGRRRGSGVGAERGGALRRSACVGQSLPCQSFRGRGLGRPDRRQPSTEGPVQGGTEVRSPGSGVRSRGSGIRDQGSEVWGTIS